MTLGPLIDAVERAMQGRSEAVATAIEVLTALFRSYNRLLSHIVANFPPEKLGTICRVGSGDDD